MVSPGVQSHATHMLIAKLLKIDFKNIQSQINVCHFSTFFRMAKTGENFPLPLHWKTEFLSNTINSLTLVKATQAVRNI